MPKARSGAETYRLDLVRYELRRSDGTRVKLERQPMELLILLVERKGQLVTRDEIASRLWPASISVESEPAINNAIRKIRAALHDSPEHPTYLETVVGKGYRFIGEIETIRSEPQPVPTPEMAPEPVEPRRMFPRNIVLAVTLGIVAIGALGWSLGRFVRPTFHSLAVLPLQNLSGDPSQRFFAEGITDELTTDLAQIASLRVISRTSTMQYGDHPKSVREIAKELNVDAVLEGSVVREGNKVRITAQLIDARRDAHIWAQSYERDFGGILNMQRAVALDIAGQVRANVSPQIRQRTPARQVTPEVYEAYLRGRHELTHQNRDNALRKAAQYFQHAIDLDPLYPDAYAGLADSFSLMANYAVMLPAEAFPRAEAAARRALEFDPILAEAHASLGFIRHHWDWDWAGAEAEYKQAVELSPSLAIGHLRYAEFLSHSGRHDEAIGEIEKARDFDPLSTAVNANVGRILFWARRYDDAIRELTRQIGLEPNQPFLRIHRGLCYLLKHMYREGLDDLKQASAMFGGEDGVGTAQAYAMSGQIELARRALRVTETSNEAGTLDWVMIAGVYATLGEKDTAFQWLDRAYQYRDFFMTGLKIDPFLDPLRDDPRFTKLMRAVRIPGA
jgi:TolB-like protein/DNA-binding winged helix-turn-helix (wHTH) protein/Tfp pilus assembly protein PilF